MEDNGVDDKKLLIAKSNKRCRKICREMWYISNDKKSNRGTSRKIESKWGSRETMDTLDGRHFITKLLLVAGKNIILVLCDRLSKMEYFMATTKGILVEGLA